jgi:hypothetical protein
MALRKIILPILLLIISLAQAQQTLSPLHSNAVLKNFLSQHPAIDKSYGKKYLNKTNAASDSLPFFEDFSSSVVVPDTNKWMDHNVFINNGYCINPPSYNVATFDGLDKEGNAYNLTTGYGYGPADTLTSVPLNFAGYVPANNIYFSFFYQMQGYGDAPQPEDSLLLQFLTLGGKWNTVWVLAGGYSMSQFTQVLLPVSSTIYLHGAFQFRFINYANMSGNLNHWNIDYIRIDKNRNANDSLITDVTIMTTPTPILKRYYSMPWNQYTANPTLENDDSTSFYVRNLKNTPVQVPSKNFVFNKQNNSLLSNTSFTLGLLTYQSPQKISYPFITPISTIIPVNDSVTIRSLYTASENSDVHRINDSVYKDQVFANYYAYDDGSAEAGYGIDFGAGKVALGFETNVVDTLRAIDMYFNQALTSNSGYNFSLTVWSSIAFGGQPEKLIHFQTVLSPDHNYSYRDSLGGFTRYMLDTPQVIPKGKFYIGWRQTSLFMLDIGLDMNYPDNFGLAFNPNMYYNASGNWAVSGFPGTVMMRPVVGKIPVVPAGIKDPVQKKSKSFSVYPNPAHALLYISMEENENNLVTIIDMKGIIVKQMPLTTKVLDVHDLTEGIYILNIFDPVLNQTYTTKFIIQ